MKQAICVFLIMWIPLFIKAQNDVEFQTWLDITQFYNTGEKSAVGGDMGIRGIVSSSDWNQYYIRPTFRYVKSKNLDFGGGAALFYTSNQIVSDLLEYRLFQEVNADWPSFGIFQFTHRLRFEQWIFDYRDDETLYSNDHFSARARYQLAVETNDFKFLNETLYFIAAAEYFQLTSSSEFFINNSRFLAILGHRLGTRFRYEFHYIYQRSRKYIEEGLQSSEHIIRLRIFRVPQLLERIEQ